jgi:protein tyrosine phosphatase (PTP) superfamily phosphohydrolase (DUF442 family)
MGDEWLAFLHGHGYNIWAMALSSHALAEILNYLPYGPDLATAGQPTEAQLAAVRAAGFEVVINLAMPTSTHTLPDEAGTVAALGMAYVPIPVVWQQPTLDDLAAFFAMVDAYAGRKLFVHCALNWRVSTFTYLYRVIRLGVAEDTARWDMLSIWEPDETWSRLIADAFAHYGVERSSSP